MARREHSYEDLAADLQTWIEDSAQKLAGAMYEGNASPGAATLTRDQQLDFYHAQLFNPDGTPNIAGRQQFVQSIGPAEQTTVTDALLRRHRGRVKEAASYG